MSHTVPKLRQHTRGYFFVRWGGKDHYLSKDKSKARQLFEDPTSDHPGALVRWMEARRIKERLRDERASKNRSTIDVAEEFLDEYASEGRIDAMKYYRKHLTRFLSVFGAVPIMLVDMPGLLSWRKDLIKLELSPKTIAHDIGAVKKLLDWSADNEHGPVLNLRALKKPFVPVPVVERWTFEEVARRVRLCAQADVALGAHVALCYLGLMRPSEVIRVINGEGRFEPVPLLKDGQPQMINDRQLVEPRGVFTLERSKNERRSSYPRNIILTDQALCWLDASRPLFTHDRSSQNLDAFGKAVRKASGTGGPKILQKSAVWHLQLTGVGEGETDILLGHSPSASWKHYGLREWSFLRQTASRISV